MNRPLLSGKSGTLIARGRPELEREVSLTQMYRLATNSIAPVLGQRVPVRGPSRLLFRSYGKVKCRPGDLVTRLTTKSGDVFDVDLASFLEWQLWAFGSYEAHFADLFRYLVTYADRCVDVGANVGVHTIRLAKLVGASGEVIAIEPDPDLAARADGNVRLNRLSNVRVIQAAAAAAGDATALLYRSGLADANRGRASLLHHTYLTGLTQEVPTVTIDEVCRDPIALIKIDVEGTEAAVVAGAAATIARDHPAIIFEYAPKSLGGQVASPFDWLSGQGYEMLLLRHRRNRITGRGGPRLSRLNELPATDGDILAIPMSMASHIRPLMN